MAAKLIMRWNVRHEMESEYFEFLVHELIPSMNKLGITDIQAVGHYAVQPSFTDGHESGIFTWGYLYHLGSSQAELWQRYEQRLAEAGMNRDAPMHKAASGGGCH